MMLDAPRKPTNIHNTFGMSPFLINGYRRVSHAMNECATIDLAGNDRVYMTITLIRNYLDYVSIKIVMPESDDEIQNNNTPIPVCPRATMTASSLN